MDGGSRRILPDSRPLALYTQNPRPFAISHANGRGRPQDNYLIPVHRPCIHKIPVHPPFLMPMDGGGRRTTTRFPSTGLVYTEPPSIHGFSHLWTGAAACTHPFSRPFALYTQNSRPFMVLHACGRERPPVFTCSPVHLPCIHRIPVNGPCIQIFCAVYDCCRSDIPGFSLPSPVLRRP